jgi:hypothetical protein
MDAMNRPATPRSDEALQVSAPGNRFPALTGCGD